MSAVFGVLFALFAGALAWIGVFMVLSGYGWFEPSMAFVFMVAAIAASVVSFREDG